MINAIVLINTARDRINPTAEKLVEISGVSEVYSVSGQFDLVAILRVADVEQMADKDLTNLLCAHLPLSPEDKQALIETLPTGDRASLMRGLLDMAAAASVDTAEHRH